MFRPAHPFASLDYRTLCEILAGRLGDVEVAVARFDGIPPTAASASRCATATAAATWLSKQADVLMLFYLLSAEELGDVLSRLGHEFDPATIPATFDHYMARTSHGSTLSRVADSWVLARSDRPRSWGLFLEALASDLDDTQGSTTTQGVQLGATAGTVDLLQRAYTGLEPRDDTLSSTPGSPTTCAACGSRSATAISASTSRSPTTR